MIGRPRHRSTRAGIPEYWIVDLNGERIEVYTEPFEADYRAVRIHLRGEQLAPAFAPELSIAVDAILGPTGDDEDDESPSDAATPEN
jgi:Uma2 family endonuclease